MTKNEKIDIRVTQEDKKKALKVVELLGKKNISHLFRDFINDIYSGYEDTQVCSLDLLIESLELELECKKVSKASAFEIYSVRTKLNMLKDLKEEKGF